MRSDDDPDLQLAADLPDPRIVQLQLIGEILSRDVSGECVALLAHIAAAYHRRERMQAES